MAPGAGFPTHPHRDMEIITYVLEGALEHRDSLGNGSVIRPGDVQRMTAGRGIMHSEFNPSRERAAGICCRSGCCRTARDWLPATSSAISIAAERAVDLRLIAVAAAAPTGSITIHQDAHVYAGHARCAARARPMSSKRAATRGCKSLAARYQVDGAKLSGGDGAAIERRGSLTIKATADSEVLLFDLP